MNPKPRSGLGRLLLGTGVLLVLGLGLTAASYTDSALLGLGTGTENAVGNPNRFDIAVKDANGAWQDADTTATAVVLPLDGSSTLSATDPVKLSVTVGNRDPGAAGVLILSLYDPDPTTDDVFDLLRFTITADGSVVATNKSASAFNAQGVTVTGVEPGDEILVTIEVTLPASVGLEMAGKSTQIGLRANGESR